VIVSTDNFAVRISGGRQTVIAPGGELDMAAAPAFAYALSQIDFAGVGSVVLELDELTFLDARGLREILSLHETCVRQSVRLTITPGRRAVQRVFEVTHAGEFLPLACSPTPT
jgi:anti-anti-sigma factor